MTNKEKLQINAFKLAILVDMIDDLTIESKALFKQKEKNLINGFTRHFKSKYGFMIEELFDVDYNNDDDVLERLKAEINQRIEDVLEITDDDSQIQ